MKIVECETCHLLFEPGTSGSKLCYFCLTSAGMSDRQFASFAVGMILTYLIDIQRELRELRKTS